MGLPIGSGDVENLVTAWLAAVDFLEEVVPVFGQAPPTGVLQCWLSPLLDGLRELMAKGAGGHGALAHSSVAPPKKLAMSASNSGMSPSSLPRSNQTYFNDCGYFSFCLQYCWKVIFSRTEQYLTLWTSFHQFPTWLIHE